jgi:thioesterase domain-containing protein/acyl carrier protein
MEKALRLLFAELFQRDDIGGEDDFFELGGDSLLAETLMTAIERDTDVVLPVSALLTAPTPSALAQSISATWHKVSDSSLVPLRDHGRGPPLICIHGQRGELAFARILAIALGADRPFYGLRAIGLAAGEWPKASLNAIVRDYLAKTERFWRTGACVLVGHCAGSLIAYEMAQRLRNKGVSVSGLIMIDPPKHQVAPWLSLARFHLWQQRLRLHARATLIQARTYLRAPAGGADRQVAVSRGTRLAAAGYMPKPYSGEALLVYSRERRKHDLDGAVSWPELVPKLQAAELGLTHSSLFKEGLLDIAATMNAFLNRVAPL